MTTEEKFITGTEGKKEYLVIGTQDGLAFAVKPLIDFSMGYVILGVRLRFANFDNADDPKSVKEYLNTSKLGVYPWFKVNPERASAVFSLNLPEPPEEMVPQEVMDGIDKAKTADTLVDEIYSHFSFDDMMEINKVKDHVKATWHVRLQDRYNKSIGLFLPENDQDNNQDNNQDDQQ